MHHSKEYLLSAELVFMASMGRLPSMKTPGRRGMVRLAKATAVVRMSWAMRRMKVGRGPMSLRVCARMMDWAHWPPRRNQAETEP